MKKIFLKIFYAFLVRPWLQLIIGVRFENRKTFDGLKQFIVVANHNSHFDTVSIMAGLPSSKLIQTRAVAAVDYFGKTSFMSKLMNLFFNAVLIKRKREKGEPSTIDVLDSQLKDGNSFILFPEGSRGKPGVMTDFKKGIAILLEKNPNIPFVPVYLNGFGRVLPKDKKCIIPLVCKVRFGDPIFPISTNIDGMLHEVKNAIVSLKSSDERDRNQFDFA